jgi:ribulose-phosphate 3-epimerase
MYDPTEPAPLPNKVEIVPAVLPKSLSDLESHAVKVKDIAKRLQVDIVDGIYAHGTGWSGTTWPYRDGDTFKKIVTEEHGLPLWDFFDYEFDLMVEDPLAVVMEYVHAGASQIIVHARSKTAVDALQKLVDLREDTGALSVKVGVALMPDAQPDELDAFEAQYDYVQVMGIDHIGRQGEPFDKAALNLLRRLRERYPNLPLQVDGSVNKTDAVELVKAGANTLVCGSAIFAQDDAGAAYKELEALVN